MAELNFDNRTMFRGDNIDYLRAMNNETVDLIATDPPFNKGRDFHATPDSLAAGASFQDRWKWDEEAHPRFTDALKNKAENKKEYAHVWTVIESARASWGDDMGAFLCFMGVRLMEMHRILKKTGSIYLHCDPTASHYLKAMMDAVFGRRNFRNEIVWAYSGGGVPKRDFPRKHDLILRYVKSDDYVFNVQRKPYGSHYEKSPTRASSRGGTRSVEYNPEGTPINDWWSDIRPIINWDKERVGYPTQKPLALYRRMIEASSNEGDMVLDPFAGCATTCVVAERIGRRWVGIDIWEGAYEVVLQRLQDEGLAVKEGRKEGRKEGTFVLSILSRSLPLETFISSPNRRSERTMGKLSRQILRSRCKGNYRRGSGCTDRRYSIILRKRKLLPRDSLPAQGVDGRTNMSTCNLTTFVRRTMGARTTSRIGYCFAARAIDGSRTSMDWQDCGERTRNEKTSAAKSGCRTRMLREARRLWHNARLKK